MAVPACTVVEPGSLVKIMGTSICHMVLGTERQMVEGMCGTVEDGIVPGLWGFEAGQSAVGDIFAWFFENGVPAAIHQQARKEHKPFLSVLENRAAALKPGESGLVALDWWNGNRSILVDVDLTGMLLGMTLATRAEEIYRALMEATAFGTRTIVEAFDSKGVKVEHLVACGGLPEKNQLLMQIYADVTGRDIKLADPLQTCSALGVPVVPRGAGTGLSGGALPHADGVLLSMAKFMRALRIDPVARLAVVQPGVRNAAISDLVAPFGLRVELPYAYFLVAREEALARASVQTFLAWLRGQAADAR